MKKRTRRDDKGSKVNDDAVGNNQRLPKTDTWPKMASDSTDTKRVKNERKTREWREIRSLSQDQQSQRRGEDGMNVNERCKRRSWETNETTFSVWSLCATAFLLFASFHSSRESLPKEYERISHQQVIPGDKPVNPVSRYQSSCFDFLLQVNVNLPLGLWLHDSFLNNSQVPSSSTTTAGIEAFLFAFEACMLCLCMFAFGPSRVFAFYYSYLLHQLLLLEKDEGEGFLLHSLSLFISLSILIVIRNNWTTSRSISPFIVPWFHCVTNSTLFLLL